VLPILFSWNLANRRALSRLVEEYRIAMKMSLMILLIIAIVALSHVAVIRSLAERVATDRLPRGIGSVLQRWATEGRNMWISIFAIVIAAAVCVGIVTFLMQPAELV
jgi:hypothetical protein